jgi:hypothetical protein
MARSCRTEIGLAGKLRNGPRNAVFELSRGAHLGHFITLSNNQGGCEYANRFRWPVCRTPAAVCAPSGAALGPPGQVVVATVAGDPRQSSGFPAVWYDADAPQEKAQ